MPRIQKTDGITIFFRSHSAFFIIIAIILLSGIIFGSTYAVSIGTKGIEVSQYLEEGFKSLKTETIPNQIEIGKAFFITNLKSLVLVFLAGLSIVLIPIILYVVFIKGLSVGFTVAFLVKDLSFSGWITSIISILPHNLILLPIYVFSGGIAFSFGLDVFKRFILKRDINIRESLLKCLIALVLSAISLLLAAFVHAFISPVILVFASNFIG